MKKILYLAIFLTSIAISSILTQLQEVDKLIQEKKFIEAFNKVHDLENLDITEDEKIALDELKKIIEKNLVVINNNTGNINEVNENGLESISFGTVSYPGDTVVSAQDFKKYEQIEKEILANGEEKNIYALLKMYMNNGLYEKAMRLGLKSKAIENIFISALAARLIGENDISINQYNKVLNNNPEHLDSLLGIGIAYRNKKDFNNARKYLNSYLNNGGTNPNVATTLKYME